ncbi:N-acetylmuramate/N-acetylglucosamine kinase [Candidatus Entotheonellaceae bacterium PAL068K]
MQHLIFPPCMRGFYSVLANRLDKKLQNVTPADLSESQTMQRFPSVKTDMSNQSSVLRCEVMMPYKQLTVQTIQLWLRKLFPTATGLPRLAPLAADASTRRYFRCHWDTPRANLPASCIIMVCDPWGKTETPDFLAVGRHLRACEVRVPQVYGVCPPDGLMCVEDFGDRTLAAQWHASAVDRLLWGQRAIDELVKMHTVGTHRRDPACPALHLAFDIPKLLSELQFFRQYAIEMLWHQDLSDAERDALDHAFTALCAVLASQLPVLCHRDYHGWNIMTHDGAVGVLDFQDARLGPQPYDLVSLLVDRGTPDVLGSELLQTLVDYYLQRMEVEAARRIDRSHFAELFEYVAVQRCLKAVGTFAYMTVVHQRQQYRQYISPTLAYIKPIMQRYRTLQALAGLLRRYVPGLTD